MFQHLPTIPEVLIENSYEDVEKIVLNPLELLAKMEAGNPHLGRAIQETAATLAQMVGEDETEEMRSYLQFFSITGILICLRYIDMALESQKLEAKLK